MISIRRMNTSDIPAGLSLCRSAGWNQVQADWQLFLTTNPEGAKVAVDENGKVAGTVTTVSYEKRFAWIGMVLVDPERRKQGIATMLLNEALKDSDDVQCMKLDATPAGREVYLKLGFKDEYLISRMYADQININGHSKASPVTEEVMGEILNIDRQIFGADRSEIIHWYWKGSPEFAHFIKENNKITAYCFGRKGFNFNSVGPVVADSIDAAKQVLSAALAQNSRPVIIDILHHSAEFIQWLSSYGFKEQRQLIRMYRGNNSWPGVPSQQFAILGPEFG